MSTLAAISDCPIEPQAHRAYDLDGVQVTEVLRVWPRPSAFHRVGTGRWQPWDPAIDVRWAEAPAEEDERAGSDDVGWNIPLQALLARIPEPVRAALMALDDPACWLALQMLCEVPEALDVVREIPSLGGLLAHALADSCEHDLACDRLRAALKHPRRDVLPLVGLPPEPWMLKALKKLDPRALSTSDPNRVRQVFKTVDGEVLKLLRHLPFLRHDVLICLRRPGLLWHASYSLLADPTEEFLLHEYLADIYFARRYRGAKPSPDRFTSRREVADFHAAMGGADALLWDPHQYRSFEVPTGDVLIDGEPPLAVHAVTSPTEMSDLARKDGLCIATDTSFPEQAQDGVAAMYRCTWRVGNKERTATVWLRLRRDGWLAEQVRMPQNAAPPSWLEDRLDRWVDRISRTTDDPGWN